ncbi:hypothetical protein QA601_14280 [Chitinispirillales bacterium ANBcel5]|uniref:hypothetical protein n=1 Tax=Cellulosispirillum alkaliphilum TaxID=3039283 RepID=UPI002A4FB593|nr:hypothetical protein [Chitinispirillales bacterium ANBcel5]
MSKKSSLKQPEPTNNEIRERLRLNNPVLISQILSFSMKYFEESISGRKDIDEKANWFLVTATGCLTLFFTGVAVLLTQLSIPINSGCVFFTSVLLSVCFLLLSVFLLFFALRARSDFRTINVLDIIEKDTIGESDQIDDSEPNSTVYDRYMAEHLLDIAKKNYRINEKKGKWLKIGQLVFLIGLFFISTVSVQLSYTLINQQGGKNGEQSQTQYNKSELRGAVFNKIGDTGTDKKEQRRDASYLRGKKTYTIKGVLMTDSDSSNRNRKYKPASSPQSRPKPPPTKPSSGGQVLTEDRK